MRRTLWTLLFAMLLQWLVGSAWAWHAPQAASPAAHCHEVVQTEQAAHPTSHAVSVHADSHHCCAIGLGMGVQVLPVPLPQAAPVSEHGPWVSLSLRPDLPPPI